MAISACPRVTPCPDATWIAVRSPLVSALSKTPARGANRTHGIDGLAPDPGFCRGGGDGYRRRREIARRHAREALLNVKARAAQEHDKQSDSDEIGAQKRPLTGVVC